MVRAVYRFAPEAVVIAVVVVLLLIIVGSAKSAEPTFRVRQGFQVKAAAAPVPVKVRWQWWDAAGNTWFTDGPAPGVPAPAPFAGPVAGTTRTTSATLAGPASTSSPAGTPTGLTTIGAPGAATSGVINCTSYG